MTLLASRLPDRMPQPYYPTVPFAIDHIIALSTAGRRKRPVEYVWKAFCSVAMIVSGTVLSDPHR